MGLRESAVYSVQHGPGSVQMRYLGEQVQLCKGQRRISFLFMKRNGKVVRLTCLNRVKNLGVN